MQKSNLSTKRAAAGGSLKQKLIIAGIVIVAAVVILAVFNLLTHGNFLKWSNVKIILGNMVYPSFLAWGICFLFACGFTDLSWGSVVVLGSFATGVVGNAYGLIPAIIAGVLLGTALVFINFSIFAFSKIPSWIASISLAMVYEAIGVFLATSDSTSSIFAAAFRKEMRFLGQLPISWIILIVGLVVVYFIYNYTTMGFNVRAIGGNQAVARSLGVNISKTLLKVGLTCGLLVGVASFLQESYAGLTTVKTGLSSIFLIFQPLAIAMLAQILQKKINIVIGVPICAFLIYAVFNVLTLMHVPSGTLQEALLCLFLIVFGIIGQRGVKGVVK